MKITKKKEINFRKILLNCLYVIICFGILFNIIFLLTTTINKNDYFEVFGISFFCMKNDLMEEDINENDLVIVKKVDEKELKEGDIIAYKINNKTRINKIINKEKEYTTKSNKNYYPDIEKVTNNQIIGKKVVNIHFLGIVLEILQSKITSVFIFLSLLLKFSYNNYIYKKKKQRAIKKKQIDKIKY